MSIAKPDSWTFTGTVVDFADGRRRCDCCSRPGMRYGCQVSTRLKSGGKKVFAYVGSDCLVDGGFRFESEYTDIQFSAEKSALFREATQRAIVRELIKLKGVISTLDWADDVSIERLIQSVQRYSLLTPKQLIFLLSVNRRANYDFPELLLKVTSKRKDWREQLSNLTTKEVTQISRFLSESQRQWLPK